MIFCVRLTVFVANWEISNEKSERASYLHIHARYYALDRLPTALTTMASSSNAGPIDQVHENGAEEDEHRYKILVLGAVGCGKTSIIGRYVNNVFSSNYKGTLGSDFAIKELDIGPKTHVKLQLWDIAGQERYSNLARAYYKGAMGAVVVYDASRPDTLDGLKSGNALKWKAEIDLHLSDENGYLPTILMANKIDLLRSEIDEAKIDSVVRDNHFLSWFATSARLNTNISSAFLYLVGEILKCDPAVNEVVDPDTIQVNNLQDNAKKGECC